MTEVTLCENSKVKWDIVGGTITAKDYRDCEDWKKPTQEDLLDMTDRAHDCLDV
jgi:hypothetical protein